jgi:hypothetical protein
MKGRMNEQLYGQVYIYTHKWTDRQTNEQTNLQHGIIGNLGLIINGEGAKACCPRELNWCVLFLEGYHTIFKHTSLDSV